MTVVEESWFDAYILHMSTQYREKVIESIFLYALGHSELIFRIGLIGSQDMVKSELARIKTEAEGLGVRYNVYCLPSEPNGYLDRTRAKQARIVLQQMLSI